MSRAVRLNSQYLRCQRVLDYDASNRCQWRLNSAGISNRISVAFDNALAPDLCIFRVFPTPIYTIINGCGLEELGVIQKYMY